MAATDGHERPGQDPGRGYPSAPSEKVLVLNSGSSSIKFELLEPGSGRRMLRGEVERIGERDPFLWVERADDAPGVRDRRPAAAPDHHAATGLVMEALRPAGGSPHDRALVAVGHRVVHGGDRSTGPALIDDATFSDIERAARLAPLHAAANLSGIAAARQWLPSVPHVAVFDTTFHHTMPEYAREYALPRGIARDNAIRRYGFHGTSHEYVSKRAALMLGRPRDDLDLITLHLGNGASATAIHAGRSIDTSMGMTPLEGLVMGTRSGDLDPAIPLLLARVTGGSPSYVDSLLNRESGLLGLCGAGDMRDVHRLIAAGDPDATLALEMFCYRVRKYIGAYYAALGGLDAVVFTAGIGENDAVVRSRCCAGLTGLGIELDEARNAADGTGERAIHRDGTDVAVLVIPTNEALEIARQALAVVRGGVTA